MPVTEKTEAKTVKKFLGNNLLSELYKAAGEAGNNGTMASLREGLCKAVPTTQVMLGRWINNTQQPSLPEAFALAQELGISVDTLCRTAEPE